jgi:hypothetical protein
VTNLMPDRYREVSLATVDHELSAETVRRYLIGREVYRRTRFVVMRSGSDAAVAAVAKTDDKPLFAPVVEVEVLALPHETTWVDAPDIDTSVPSQLARAARERANGARCVIVAGRHGHVSFLLDPTPTRVRVVDVAPPYPAKLVDQAQAVLDVADDLPPVELVADVIDLADLAGTHHTDSYLFPCRGSGLVLGAQTAYLDERPPDGDWVLVGCARSREIHRWFYHRDPPSVEMCPRQLAAADRTATGPPTLTRCCLLEEERYDRTADSAVVPWGASLSLIRTALSDLIGDGGIHGSTAD